MIKSIVLQNFQSHKDTTLDLHPGVNLICGSSDSGKSSIIRALKWLATNRPLGDGFVSWGSKKDTYVTVFADDFNIVHQPGFYSLTNKEVSNSWNAIGTTVPESVVQALNISELSWQSQMDAPFLLSASPGEVARTLNEVADLDKIDTALANINRMARDNRTNLVATAQEKQRLEIELSQYRGLDERMKKIAQLQELERRADLLEQMVEDGSGMLLEGSAIQRELDKVKDMSDAEDELNGLMDMVGQVKEIDSTVAGMESQVLAVGVTRTRLIRASKELEELEKSWKEKSRGRCPLCGRSG